MIDNMSWFLQNWWEHVSPDKLVFPKLWRVLREAAFGNAAVIYTLVLPLLSKIQVPDTIKLEDFYLKLMSSLIDGWVYDDPVCCFSGIGKEDRELFSEDMSLGGLLLRVFQWEVLIWTEEVFEWVFIPVRLLSMSPEKKWVYKFQQVPVLIRKLSGNWFWLLFEKIMEFQEVLVRILILEK